MEINIYCALNHRIAPGAQSPLHTKSTTMKRFFILTTACILTLNSWGQLPQTDWAFRIGGDDLILTQGLQVDPEGNTILAGQFTKTIDVEPGSGIKNLTSEGNYDCFVSKYDPNGDLIWAKRYGGSSYDDISAMHTDAQGNIFLTGIFGETVDFNPGGGTLYKTSAGLADIYLLKLDTEGNFVWAKHFGGMNYDGPRSVFVDAAGSIYLTGYFGDGADFDPGAGSYILQSQGGADAFVMKLSSAGNPAWVKQLGGPEDVIGYNIAADDNGNVYSTGIFKGTVDLDPGTTTNFKTAVGNWDTYISKLNASGNIVWARQISGMDDEICNSMVIDPSNNILLAGYFFGTADLDPGAGIYPVTSKGDYDGFVIKINAQGQLLWDYPIHNLLNVIPEVAAVDTSGNLVVMGRFVDDVDFSKDTLNPLQLTSVGGQDIFWLNISTDGTFKWASSIGSIEHDGGADFGLALDHEGNIYSSAWIRAAIDADPGPDSIILPSSAPLWDIFVSKMHEVTSGIIPINHPLDILIAPNPTSGTFTMDMGTITDPITVNIYNAAGQPLYVATFEGGGKYEINIPNAGGPHYLKVVLQNGQSMIKKIILIPR
jgi:hypothetical protein